MRLATVRGESGLRVARFEADHYVDLGPGDVGALLAEPGWRDRAAAAGPQLDAAACALAPVVPRPGKIICVGLNYRSHILEMGRDVPTRPTLFAKYPESLIGAHDDLVLPPESEQVDWEAELAVVVGRRIRRADPAAAASAIAGYSLVNDVTLRDWQFRTREWLQGKTWEATTPFGPWLVTPDELPADAILTCRVDDEVVQRAAIADLVFDPAELVSYVSTILTLQPGDVIATGTPGGVGHGRTPPRYLRPGQTLSTEVDGLGAAVNLVRAAAEVAAR